VDVSDVNGGGRSSGRRGHRCRFRTTRIDSFDTDVAADEAERMGSSAGLGPPVTTTMDGDYGG
jgi:hypothetical protein